MGGSRIYRPGDDEFADDVIPHAAARQYAGRFSPTNEGIEDDADVLGVLGEQAVCAFFGEDPDVWIQSGTLTDGWFLELAGLRIKSYATYSPGHIIVKDGKVNADVYVLVYVHPTGMWPSCLGWASGGDIRSAPIRTTSGGKYAISGHWYPRQRNRPLGPLRAEIAAARAEGRPAEVESIRPIVTGRLEG